MQMLSEPYVYLMGTAGLKKNVALTVIGKSSFVLIQLW